MNIHIRESLPQAQREIFDALVELGVDNTVAYANISSRPLSYLRQKIRKLEEKDVTEAEANGIMIKELDGGETK